MSKWIDWTPPINVTMRPARPPVSRDTPVEVLLGDNTRLVLEHAGDLYWDRYEDEISIVAYRAVSWWKRWLL